MILQMMFVMLFWIVPAAALAQTAVPSATSASAVANTATTTAWHGLSVTSVTTQTAKTDDLKAGDIIISLDGLPVIDALALTSKLDQSAAGATTTIGRMRGRQLDIVKLLIGTRSARPVEELAPHAAPRLMLDVGGHSGVPKAVAFTPDGKFLVSAGDDKVVRIWDVASGETVRTIRGEVTPGSPGKIFAMALSPDGAELAVGGWMKSPGERGHHIRIYDFATGRLKAMLKGHTGVVSGLAYSADGSLLISGGGAGDAIIWDVRQSKIKHTLLGHSDSVYGVALTPDGARAVTGSYDKTLRLWDISNGQFIAELKGHSEKVHTVSVNPRNGRIASGDYAGAILMWDGKSGELLSTWPSIGAGVGALEFTANGAHLLATCFAISSKCKHVQRIFDSESGQVTASYTRHDGGVRAAKISPDQRLVATAGGRANEIHLWDLSTGRAVLAADKQPITLRGSGSAVYALESSSDGTHVGWGRTWKPNDAPKKYGPLEFQIRLPGVGVPLGQPVATYAAAGVTWLQASHERGTVRLTRSRGGKFDYYAILEIIKDGAIVANIQRDSTTGHTHHAYTLTPDGLRVVSGGGGGYLAAYDLTGKFIGEYVGHEGDVWAVVASADGRLLFSGSDDDTLKIWNLKTRELLATLFYSRDGEWAMWTEAGYYTGSPGAGRIVGWQVNNGHDREADYVTGAQVRGKLLRPDIVESALRLGSAKQAIKQAGLDSVNVESILRQRPPVVRVLGGGRALAAFGGRTVLTVITDANPLPVDELKFSVTGGGGERVVTARAVALPAGVVAQRPDGSRATAYELPLYGGENTVRVVARNAGGESQSAFAAIRHEGEGALDRRGTLWIVAAGVNTYSGAPGLYASLSFAVKDADVFSATAIASMKGSHTKIEATVLINGRGPEREPTRANILAALARVMREAGDNDTVIVFLAGHGENWTGGRYHFLPTDFARTVATDIGQNVIDWEADIQSVLAKSRGRKVLFLDACHAGNAYNRTLLAAADADRFVAFSAAGPDQLANEFDAEGHGAFTWAVIKGLAGHEQASDPLENGVTVYRLGDFLNVEVRRRTQGRQAPEYRSGQGNFVLTRK
jgi:WD40 repeat protein